ncbi:MAG: STN domain-containing protein [Planctomycetaceae bacterium]|nr:STN domain-containing protein [Planctomycetaceae bacterium]
MSHLRCWAVGCVTGLFVGGLAADLFAADADLTAARPVAREAESKLLAGLHKPVKAEWSNVPVEQVLISLAKSAGVNLWIDREALSAEGISLQDSLVELHLGEATVWQTLHFLLEPLLLDWHGADGVLSITTQTRAHEIYVTRTYDVQAIVAALEPQLKALPPRLRSHFGGGAGAFSGSVNSGGGGGGLFRVPTPAEATLKSSFVLPQFGGGGGGGGFVSVGQGGAGIRVGGQPTMKGEEVLAELLIGSDIVGSMWESTYGQGGTVTVGRGRLIVRQQYQVHFRIRELLLAVEEYVVRGAKVKLILVARPGYPHDEDAAILKRLAEPRDISLKEAPLDKILAELANEGRYRLWLDKEALSGEGIDFKQQVTLTLTGMSLDTVLHKLLEPLFLTFLIEEGTLIVTPILKAEEGMPMRVYFTGDIPEARSEIDLLTAIQKAASGKWGPEGEPGTLWKAVPDWLVVRQTQRCHREIMELLDDLRQAAVAPLAAAPEFELRLYPVADASALQDLITSLPKLIPAWDAKEDSIVVLGQSLAIKQPVVVHERLDEIFSALNQAATRLKLPKEPRPAPGTKSPPPVSGNQQKSK